jgi:broad specificity phosphatase PhoE
MPPTRPLVLLARHGRTSLNDPKAPRLRAWENPPLDRRGELDAEFAAMRIDPFNPQMIYSSDLLRDTQTAHIIAGKLGNIPTETDYDLRTADMGEWQGELESDVAPHVMEWYKHPWTDAPSGESYNVFLSRFLGCFNPKLEISRNCPPFRPTLIVCHGRNIAALHSIHAHIPPWEALTVMPGGVALISQTPDGRYEFEFLTETEPILVDA